MTTERIDIVVSETGARTVKRNIEDIGKSAENSAGGIDLLKNSLAGIGAYFGVQQIRELTSTWTDLTSRVTIAAGSIANATAVMDRLQAVARRTYASLESTSEIYLQNATALNDLGYSTAQQLDFTEAMTNALVVSGTKGQRAESVINALSKAMMAGKLQGENWNTVLTTGGRVVQALADGLGVSVDELRKMAIEGQLTSQKTFPALVSQLQKLRDEADSMPATINDALVNLRTGLMSVIGTMSQDFGFSDAVVKSIDYVRENLDTLIKTLVVVGITAAAAFAPAVILRFGAAINSLFVLIAANPIGALALGLVAAAAAAVVFQDQINIGVDEVTTMRDLLPALGAEASDAFNALAFGAGQAWDVLKEVDQAVQDITSSTVIATGSWTDSFEDFYSDVGNGWTGIVVAVAKTLDAIAGSLTVSALSWIRLFAGIPGAIDEAFRRAYNHVTEHIEGMINITIDGINSLRGFLGKDLLQNVNFQRLEIDEDYFKKYGESIARAVDDGFASQGQFMEKTVRRVLSNAQENAQKRLKEAAGNEAANLENGRPGAGAPGGLDAKEIKRLQDQLLGLLNRISPVTGAILEQEKATKLLSAARRAGLITATEEATYLERVKDYYEDLIAPMKAYLRDKDLELEGLKLTSREQAIANEVYNTTLALRAKGETVGAAEIAQIEQRARAIDRQKTVQTELNSIYEQTIGAVEQLRAKQEALGMALQNQWITLDQYNLRMNQLGIEAANLRIQMGQGLPDDAFIASFGRILEGWDGMLSGMTTSFGDFFVSFTDGFADSVGRAIVYSEDLGEALTNVARSAVSELISALVKLGIQWVINNTMGQTLAATSAATTTALSVATGAAVAAAWAPAAAAVSLATMGANAAPAMAGIASANLLARSTALFKDGGYTGNFGRDQIAGMVHGQEFVVNAAATARNLPLLEALNAGLMPTLPQSSAVSVPMASVGGSGPRVDVTIINNANNTEVTTQRTEDADGNVDMVVMLNSVENGLAARMKAGRGPLHNATKSAFGLNPKTASTRG